MTDEHAQTAAYRLRLPSDLPALLGTFHSFTVPEQWPDLLRQVWDHGGKPHDPTWSLPIAGRLNQALRALVPDALYTGKLDVDSPNTWLYSRQPVDTSLLKRTMQSHVQAWLDSKSDYPRLREVVNALDVQSHGGDWTPVRVDPAWLGTNEAGTATVDPILFRLIPEVVAERILRLGKYDDELSFVQVATSEGAELVSWPPQAHAGRKTSNGESRLSHYSAVLKIRLHTVPFEPAPRLHLGVSIRRWVSSGKLFIPSGIATSVYVRPQSDPATGFGGTRLAVPSLVYDRKVQDYVWASNGPAGVLESLTVGEKFPDAARIKTDPGAYFPPTTALEAAVAYDNRMGGHEINTGIMPDERQRILTWAAQALPDAFEPALGLEGLSRGLRTDKQYVTRTSLPKEPKPPKQKYDPDDAQAARQYKEDYAAYEQDRMDWEADHAVALAQRDQDDAENARRNRELLALGMQGSELRIDLVTDTDEVRAGLLEAARTWLGLDPVTDPDMPSDHVVFRDGDLRVRLICHTAGRLTSPLGNGNVPGRGAAHRQAIDDRATLVKDYLDSQEFTTELALVEIQEPATFAKTLRRSDPYRAIRQGAARAGRVTQFITSTGEGALSFRALAAWADGLRSLGIGLVPPYSKRLSLPETIDQVAFWQVKRNVTTTVTDPVFMPIAILVRSGETRVLARTPETDGWIPYNELLCQLACAPPRPKELAKAHRQSEEMTRFLRVTLPSLKGRPLLLITDAENLRSRWKWLTDDGLRVDRISLGETGTTKLALHNKQLRIVRVRTDAGRLETPMWWATPDANGVSGFTTGLLQPVGAGDENRVFYSLSAKNAKLNSHNRTLRKFTRNGTKAPSPHEAAPVPRMLEVTVAGLAPADDAETAAAAWATFVHQQRFTADYPDGRERPYALDLCKRAGDYAFPESARDEDDDPAPEDPEFEQGVLDL